MHSENFQLLSLRCARLRGNPVVALDSAKLCSSTPSLPLEPQMLNRNKQLQSTNQLKAFFCKPVPVSTVLSNENINLVGRDEEVQLFI